MNSLQNNNVDRVVKQVQVDQSSSWVERGSCERHPRSTKGPACYKYFLIFIPHPAFQIEFAREKSGIMIFIYTKQIWQLITQYIIENVLNNCKRREQKKDRLKK